MRNALLLMALLAVIGVYSGYSIFADMKKASDTSLFLRLEALPFAPE